MIMKHEKKGKIDRHKNPVLGIKQFSNSKAILSDPGKENPKIWKARGAVLLAEEIKWYVDEGLLIAKEDFNEDNLKGASYSMTPDLDGAWIINKEGQHNPLEKRKNDKGEYFLVPKNALVYIRIKERLIMPYYIIGRHKLKIKYVYRGLLLGTGPQVDPGYYGQLIIPLHNLTDNNVEIYLDDSFISIDFVRTSELTLNKGVPDSDDMFREMYPEKKQIHEEKIKKRTTLIAYLNGARPHSSLDILTFQIKKNLKRINRTLLIDVGMFIGIIAIAVALFIVLLTKIDNLPTVHRVEVLEKSLPSVVELEIEIRDLNNKLKIQVEDAERFNKLEERIGLLEKDIRENQTRKYDESLEPSDEVP